MFAIPGVALPVEPGKRIGLTEALNNQKPLLWGFLLVIERYGRLYFKAM